MAKIAGRSSGDANSKKKRKTTGPKAASMKIKAPSDNPFEVIWSRRKFDILGKKRKGEERRIGLARSRAIQKRKNTLLKEYEKSAKCSVFVDKRIGENNGELGDFEKGIMRSQREHQLKLKKQSKYNLSDGEEADILDAAGLGPFSERDDFEDEMLSDDDQVEEETDEAQKKLAILKGINVHDPSSMEGEENKHKTKKEVMEEVILKSKFFKAERAREKEENEHLMEQLDKSFSSLVQSQVLLSLTQPGKMNALKALANKEIPDEHVKDEALEKRVAETSKQEGADYYDKLVGEMLLDIRARPSDRTKTPEEIAQEERERLEQLEEERKKRMVAAEELTDEENDDIAKPPCQKIRSISGDDLGDSFSFEEEAKTKKGWVDKILERKDASESDDGDEDSSDDSESTELVSGNEGSSEENSVEENGVKDKIHNLKNWEQSDDDNIGMDLEDDEEYGHNIDDDKGELESKEQNISYVKDIVETVSRDTESLDAKKMRTSGRKQSAPVDIPFLIEAPKNMEELNALVENCSNENVIVVINRIRATNAIRLAAENRKKMQVFYGVLLQYFAVLANKRPLNFNLLNLLVKPLMEMSVEIPYFSAICARQRILRIRTQFCEAVKNSGNGCWPSFKTLCLLQLWSMIFPCSDFRHVVMTPALLLMCEYLLRCPICSGRDIAVGSFLCSMVLSVSKQSQKFCPEAIMFIKTLLMAANTKNPSQEFQLYHHMEQKVLGDLLYIRGHVNEIGPLNLLSVMEMPEDSSFFSSDCFRASALVTLVETLKGFVDSCKHLSSFPEIFLPIASLVLEVANQPHMEAALQDKFNDVAQLINGKAEEHHMIRRPLQMRKQKPVPIKLVNPQFEENYVKGRDYDPDRDRAERRKLKKQLKREAKGAARELRKDNYFLFEVKEKENSLQQAERTERFGKARAFLQEQEHAFKSGQLGKGRKRRR
ncbi:hypothetical protein K2173_015087 [Erythroxylum novogranatense]|uniref:Nucleolar protein 14 n=1 Tax=Erythroxylum novogranatense TaxID=1862640 RepID=A0AAV8T0Y4_9ROSI|nr:hypothetical protein K2173_015087 [Erythroxylum novogranatense]